jgi:hypothetical protein
MKAVGILAWALLVSAGMLGLMRYAAAPGKSGQAPQSWPTNESISPAPGRFNLVLSLHPQCPCSVATAEELSGILARTGEAMEVHALVFTPAGAGNDWSKTSLIETVEQLPHVRIIRDVDGRQAERFGALTSGDAQLYSPDGELIFHGGVTGARGHAGDNAGRDAVEDLVLGGGSSLHSTPVFGCSLQAQAERSDEK